MTWRAASLSSIPMGTCRNRFLKLPRVEPAGTADGYLLLSSSTDCHQAASIKEYRVGQVLFATSLPVTPAAQLSGIRSSQGVSSS